MTVFINFCFYIETWKLAQFAYNQGLGQGFFFVKKIIIILTDLTGCYSNGHGFTAAIINCIMTFRQNSKQWASQKSF